MKKAAKFIGVLLFWLFVWEAAALFVNREVLLPSPIQSAAALFSLCTTAKFWLSVFSTLGRILTGFLCGVVTGYLAAILTFRFPVAKALLSPMFTAIRATPVASFIILALVWIGRSNVPTFISFLMVLPVVWNAVSSGFESAGRQLLEVVQIFRFSYFKKFRLIYIPSSFSFFVSALLTSIGLSWKAGVAAEVLCSLKNSIGGALYDSKLYLESSDLFAWTFTVILLSLGLEKLLTTGAAMLAAGKRKGRGDA